MDILVGVNIVVLVSPRTHGRYPKGHRSVLFRIRIQQPVVVLIELLSVVVFLDNGWPLGAPWKYGRILGVVRLGTSREMETTHARVPRGDAEIGVSDEEDPRLAMFLIFGQSVKTKTPVSLGVGTTVRYTTVDVRHDRPRERRTLIIMKAKQGFCFS